MTTPTNKGARNQYRIRISVESDRYFSGSRVIHVNITRLASYADNHFTAAELRIVRAVEFHITQFLEATYHGRWEQITDYRRLDFLQPEVLLDRFGGFLPDLSKGMHGRAHERKMFRKTRYQRKLHQLIQR